MLSEERFKSFRMFFFILYGYNSDRASEEKPKDFCQNGQHFGNSTIFDLEGVRHVAKGSGRRGQPPLPGGQEGPFRRAQRAEKGRRDRAKRSF